MALTRDEILAAQDLPTEKVAVKAWGGEVLVRTLNGGDREAFERANYEAKGANVMARIVAWCVVDEAGNRVFSDDDIPALAKKNGDALLAVTVVAQRLNGLLPQAVEQAAKN